MRGKAAVYHTPLVELDQAGRRRMYSEGPSGSRYRRPRRFLENVGQSTWGLKLVQTVALVS